MASTVPPDLIAYLRSLGLSEDEIQEYLRRAGLLPPEPSSALDEIPEEGVLAPKQTRELATRLGLSGREAAILAGTVEPAPEEIEALDKKLALQQALGTEVPFPLGDLANELLKPPAGAGEEEIPSRPRERRQQVIAELVKAGVRPDDYEKLADVVSPQEFEEALTTIYGQRPKEEKPSLRGVADAAKKLGLSGRETAVLLGTAEGSDQDLEAIASKLGVSPEELIDPATGAVSLRALSRAAKARGLSPEELQGLMSEAKSGEPSEEDRGVLGELGAGFQRGLLSIGQAGAKGLATVTGARRLHRWAGELERAAIAADEVLGSEADSIPEEVASAVGEFLGQIAPSIGVAAIGHAVGGTAAAAAGAFGVASFLPNVGDAAETAEKRFGVEDPAVSVTAGFLMALLDTAAFSKGVGRLLGSEADEAAMKAIVEAVKAGKMGPGKAVLEGFVKLLSGQSKGAAVEATTEVAQDLIAKAAAAIDSGDWDAFRENLLQEASDTFTKVALGTFFGTGPGAGFSVLSGFVQSAPGGGFIEGASPEEEAKAADEAIASMLERAGLTLEPTEAPAQGPGPQPSEGASPAQELSISAEELFPGLTSEEAPRSLMTAEERGLGGIGAPAFEEAEQAPSPFEQAFGKQEEDKFESAVALMRQGRRDDAALVLFGDIADVETELSPFPEEWVSAVLAAAQGVGPEASEEPLGTEAGAFPIRASERRPTSTRGGKFGPQDLGSDISGQVALRAAQPAQPRVYGTSGVYELSRPETDPPRGYEVLTIKLRTLSEAEGVKNRLKKVSGIAWVSRVGEVVVAAVDPSITTRIVASVHAHGDYAKVLANDQEARIVKGGIGYGVGPNLQQALANGVFRKYGLSHRITIAEVNPQGVDLTKYGLRNRDALYAAGTLWQERRLTSEVSVPYMSERELELLKFVNTTLNVRWVPMKTSLVDTAGVNMAIRSHSGPVEIIITSGPKQRSFVVAHEIGHSIASRLREKGIDVDQIGETILRTVPDLRFNIRMRGYTQEETYEEAFAEAFGYLMANADQDTRAAFLAASPHPFVAAVVDELASRVSELSELATKGRHVPEGSFSQMFDAYHDTLVNIFSHALTRIERIGPNTELEAALTEVTTPLANLPPQHRAEVLRFRREEEATEEAGAEATQAPNAPEREAGLKKYAPASPEEITAAARSYAAIARAAKTPKERLAAKIAERIVRTHGYLSPTRRAIPLGLPNSVKSPRDFVAMIEAAIDVTEAGRDIGGHEWYERSMYDLAVKRLGYEWPLTEHEARKIAAVLAVTSPRVSVRANVAISSIILAATEARDGRVHDPIAAARDFGLNFITGNVTRATELATMSSDEIAKAMDDMWHSSDAPRNFGRKVKSFYEALVRATGHDPGTTSAAADSFVADTWIARSIGVAPDFLPKSRAYDVVASVFTEIANELGLRAHEAQAAFWVALRSAERALTSGDVDDLVSDDLRSKLRSALELAEFTDAETWKQMFGVAAELARRHPWVESYADALTGVFTSLIVRHSGVDVGYFKRLIADVIRSALPERIAKEADIHVAGDVATVSFPLPVDSAFLSDVAEAVESVAAAIGGEVSVRAAVLGRGIPEIGAAVSLSEKDAATFAKRLLSMGESTPFAIVRGDALASELRRTAVRMISSDPELMRELTSAGLTPEDAVHVSHNGELYAYVDDSVFSKANKITAFQRLIRAIKEVSRGEERVAFGGSRILDLGARARRRGREADAGLLAQAPELGESVRRERRTAPTQAQGPVQQGTVSAQGAGQPTGQVTVDDVVQMFGRAEELIAQTSEQRAIDAKAIAKFERISRGLRALLSDRLAPAYDALKRAFGPDYARRLLDDLRYSSGPAEAVVIRMRQILDDLRNSGVTIDEIGAWLFLRRISGEEYHWDPAQGKWVHGPGKVTRGRATVENPLGLDKRKAADLLVQLEARLGPDKRAAIDRAIDRMLDIYDKVMDEVERSGGFPQSAVEFMRENRFYVTFMFPHPIPDPLAEQPGSWPTGEVERQLGSALDAANPVFATAAKMAMLLQTATRRRVQSEVIDALLKLGLAKKAPESGGPGAPEIATLWRYEGDERVRYWVPRSVAEAMNSAPALGYLVGKGLRFMNSLIRGAWVTYSPRFVAFNPVRDVRQTLMLLSEVKTPLDVARFVKTWLKTFREIYKAEKKEGGFAESVVEAMELGALGSGYLGSFAQFSGETDLVEWSLGVMTEADERPAIERWPIIGKPATFLRVLGEVQEQATKVAALRYLRSKGVPVDVAVDAVRNRAGTPNYRRSGRLGALLQFLFPFLNVRKEGYRAIALAAKDDPGVFFTKAVIFGVIPAVVRWSLRTGLALSLYQMFRPDDDDDEKAGIVMATKVLARAARGDFANYNIIPLGLDADDKAVYLRLPMDHATQLMSGLTISVLDGVLRKRGDLSSTFDLVSDSLAYAAGELPSAHPLVQFVADTTMIALGFNPPDFWRGSYKVPRNVFEARDWRSLRYVAAKDLSGLLGVMGFSIARLPEVGKGKSDPLTVILKNPALDITSGWVLRRTDAGLRDAVDRLIERKRVERARRVLALDELITTAVEEGRPIGWILQEGRKAGLIKPTNREQLMQQLRSIRSKYLEKKGLVYRKNYRHLTSEELKAVEELLAELGEELR